jgi:hypothetical protein
MVTPRHGLGDELHFELVVVLEIGGVVVRAS